MGFGFPECRVACLSSGDCPSSLVCSEAGLCGRELNACGIAISTNLGRELPGAPVNVAAPDAAALPNAQDGDAGTDATVEPALEQVPDPAGCEIIAPRPEQLCLGESCLELSTAMRDSLALWLEPSSLGEPGSSVSVWCDRSGQRNHGYPGAAGPLSTPLEVVRDESREVATADLQRAVWLQDNWLYLGADERLNFGTSELLVLFVMSVLVEEDLVTPDLWAPTTLFLASGLGRYALTVLAQPPPVAGVEALIAEAGTPTLVRQDWNLFDARSRLHGLYRGSEVFEYRLNGLSQGISELSPAIDLSSPENVAGFGSGDLILTSATFVSVRLTAALVFRGPLDPSDLQRTEQFLCGSLDGCVPVQ
jgi:hypothetical protein